MKRFAYITFGLFLLVFFMIFPSTTFASQSAYLANSSEWQYKGVNSVEGLPEVKHYIWEMARPPYGPFDKIALHRMVKEPLNQQMIPDLPAPDKRKVLFVIPGTWSRGYSPSANPDQSINLFFAVNGYDVYSMDFRTMYVPNYAYDQFSEYNVDISSTGDWTYGVFREDIKACIDLTKEISTANKVFLGGISRGVTQMWIYASKYLADVKGLIGMDGGGIKSAPVSGVTNILADMTSQEIQAATAAYDAAVEDFKNNEVLLSEVGGYEQGQWGAAVPYSTSVVGFANIDDYVAYVRAYVYNWAGDPPGPLNNVTDVAAYTTYWAWGEGKVTNIFTPYPGGDGETYMDPAALNLGRGQYTRYWPRIQDQETSATFGGGGLAKYDDCPFLDYDDNWKDINVPVLSFNGELSCAGGCEGKSIEYTLNNLSTSDVTIIYLQDYGHLDVYYGTHSREDMKEPMLQWMDERKGGTWRERIGSAWWESM